jgi:hypothetical protein
MDRLRTITAGLTLVAFRKGFGDLRARPSLALSLPRGANQ